MIINYSREERGNFLNKSCLGAVLNKYAIHRWAINKRTRRRTPVRCCQSEEITNLVNTIQNDL